MPPSQDDRPQRATCHLFARILHRFCPIDPGCISAERLNQSPSGPISGTASGPTISKGAMEMNRVHYRILQDFLNVALMGLAVGVIFSMAVTGIVFLLSGKTLAGEDPATLSQPAEPKQVMLLQEPERRDPDARNAIRYVAEV
jgi:hypothetical protein